MERTINLPKSAPCLGALRMRSRFAPPSRSQPGKPDCIVIQRPMSRGSRHGHALDHAADLAVPVRVRMRGRGRAVAPGPDHAGIVHPMVSRPADGAPDPPAGSWAGRISSSRFGSGGRGRRHHRLPAQAPRTPAATGRATLHHWTKACPRSVLKVFVELFNDGLIYKEQSTGHWDREAAHCHFPISKCSSRDQGNLWHIKFRLWSDEFTCATTGRKTCSATPRSRCHPDNAPQAPDRRTVVLPAVGAASRSSATIMPSREGTCAVKNSRRPTTSTTSRSAVRHISRDLLSRHRSPALPSTAHRIPGKALPHRPRLD